VEARDRVLRSMLPEIHENVHDGRPHLTRRREIAPVVPITPDSAATPDDAIDGAGDGGGEPLQAPREGGAGGGLHDQMDVVSLNTEVNDTDRGASGQARKAPLYGPERSLGAEIRCSDASAHRHCREVEV
jgi:hypothetical protein